MLQEVEIKSDNNAFLEPYTVQKFVKEIMSRTNIILPPEIVMLSRPYRSPGTFKVPLALLDDNGDQVTVSLQLIPRQASAAELKALGIKPASATED